MKKYMIIALCTISSINGMEKTLITKKPEREPREWDAQAYENGNKFQTTAFLHLLKTNGIQTENRTIISAGCGTGKIESILAEKATFVHDFDASKNMINFAQKKYGHINHLYFEDCFAEDFKSPILRQLALASFCLHWVEDKKQALQNINDSLEIGGEFFANVRTSDDLPLEIVVATEMMPLITKTVCFFTNKTVLELSGSSYPSHQELNNMLTETGFEILKSEKQEYIHTTTREDMVDLQKPILFSRPIMKLLPDIFIQPLFDEFIDRYLAKLQKTDDNQFVDTYNAVIIHARKIQKQSGNHEKIYDDGPILDE